MVQDIDADDPAGLNEAPGNGEVFFGRGRVAGRVVVGKDEGGGRDGDRRLVDLAGVDDRGVQTPDRNDLAPQDLIPRVEVEADEVLAVGCPDVSAEVEDRFGSAD